MPKKPADYSKGLIYKLCSNDTDIKDIYVGSTTNFNYRKTQHKTNCNNEKQSAYNRNVYKFIRENGGWEEWNMILVESYPCKSSLDLHKREREIIEELKSTLNKHIPSRTKKEWRENNKEHIAVYRKKHYEENKEQKKEYRKKNYEENKEKILEQKKEYYEKNKEQIAEKSKEYRNDNKEHIAKKQKEYNEIKVECECGAISTKKNLARHKQSKKHQNYINALHSHHL